MKQNNPSKIGLALAGGGISGGIYEVGALRAIEEAVDGLDFREAVTFVGVSAGSFNAACLANGITTGQLCRSILTAENGEPEFKPDLFFTPAIGRYFKKGIAIPSLAFDAFYDYFSKPHDMTLWKSIMRLTRALPGGLFSNLPLQKFLEKMFSMKGRSNCFKELGQKLYVVAADLDSGEAVIFGEEGWDHIPVSEAVRASSALPGVYHPVEIDGRYYVDGVLLKTMYASVALKNDAEIVFCINPIVPVNTLRAVEHGVMKRGYLVDRGLLSILSQTMRTVIHSRMEMGIACYETSFSDRDIILFEPERDDYAMFFTNIFSFKARKFVCEHAYTQTLKYFRKNYDDIEKKLTPHGLKLNRRVIFEKDRNLWESVGMVRKRKKAAWSSDLTKALDQLEDAVFEQDAT